MPAEEIRALRETLGLSQKDFAHLLNVAVFTVKRWEDSTCPHRPAGLSHEVLNALQQVVEELGDARKRKSVGRRLRLGVGALVREALIGR